MHNATSLRRVCSCLPRGFEQRSALTIFVLYQGSRLFSPFAVQHQLNPLEPTFLHMGHGFHDQGMVGFSRPLLGAARPA